MNFFAKDSDKNSFRIAVFVQLQGYYLPIASFMTLRQKGFRKHCGKKTVWKIKKNSFKNIVVPCFSMFSIITHTVPKLYMCLLCCLENVLDMKDYRVLSCCEGLTNSTCLLKL